MASASVRVLMASDAHAAALAEFFREAWNSEGTAASLLAARRRSATENVAQPGAEVPAAIAVSGEKVIGYVTSIPMRVHAAGCDWPAYWVKGLMVLPEYRNGPIGFLVLKQLLGAIPRSGVLVVAPAARRLLEALGHRDLGVIPNYLRVLRGGRVLAQLDAGLIGGVPPWAATGLTVVQRTGLARPIGAAGALAFSAYALTAGRGALGYRLQHGPVSPEAIDRLWERARDGFGAASVRDGTTMTRRYGIATCNDAAHTAASVWRGEDLAGLAVVRRPRENGDPRLRGIRVATISDLLFPLDDPSAGLVTLRCAEQAARHLGADALLCSTPNPLVARLLRRQAYFRLGGNVHFLWREASETSAKVPELLEHWWITRGDAESDGVF
jgi:hypothetical protein